MNKSRKSALKVFALAMVVAIAAPTFNTLSAFAIGRDDYKAVLDYDNLEDAQAAAAKLNKELTGEGSVLLKNDGTLPLNEGSRVTVFGSAATSLQGATGSITVPAALEAAGFDVNPKVITENSDFHHDEIRLFNSAAIVVLKRGGGEGSDLATVTSEVATEEENVGGWEHQALGVNSKGETVKHNLMLTDAELALIEQAKETCDKVVVLLNTSNVMEMFNLDQDDEINAIMHIGRPGKNGIEAVGELLSGKLNPSGKTVDAWNADFSEDPVWYNFRANEQNAAGSNTYILPDGSAANKTGFHGIDYEEDIYLGYKYWETVYAEIKAGTIGYDVENDALYTVTAEKPAAEDKDANAEAWYESAVVYTFGYGLSYTNFNIVVKGISKDSFTAAEVSSSKATGEAAYETVTVTVEVTNTGKTAGKEVVQLYANAPYTSGEVEKASVNLVGYAKTENLKPGQTQKIDIEVNLQDIASYDYLDANNNGYKTYELDEGEYKLYAANSAHVTDATPYAAFEVTGGDGILGLDDFSGAELKNIFSKENGRYYSLRKNDADWNDDGVVDANDAVFSEEMTLLSRADMVGTFPQSPVTTIVVNDVAIDSVEEFSTEKAYAIGDIVKVTTVTGGVTGSSNVEYFQFKTAHAAGALNAEEVETLKGSYTGALVVSEEFAQMMQYYNVYNLDTWDAETKSYVYSDKLFSADVEANPWAGNEEGLYDVTADMMKGWSQMASAELQKVAAEGDDWILFADLAGIRYTDTEVITEGKLKGMTGVEAWTKFMNQWTWEDFYTAGWSGGGNGSAVANLGIPAGGAADGPNNWNSTHLWCCNTTIGSTWNTELAERQGIITANMGLLKNNGKSQWMNPAINTHRSPFSGRNNEYYGQDGYHMGSIAIAVTLGAQSRGVGCHLKHMFLNDQETNRNGMDLFTWVSEQAIREIYGKSFQMGIQEGGATGAMTAFARIGSVPVPTNYNFHELLVRDQWGAEEYMFHTDMYNGQKACAPVDLIIRAGNNHAPITKASTNGATGDNSISGRWDANYQNPLTGGLGGVYIGKNDETTGQQVYYSNNQWYVVRLRAMQMYSEYANQAQIKSGIDTTGYVGSALEATQGKSTSFDVSYAGAANASVAKYTVLSGELPAGLSLNASTGVISGTANDAGTYKFTVQGLFENWITVKADFTITVASQITIDATDAVVGEEFFAVVDASAINSNATLSATGLPEGLEIDEDGIISGTPTEKGEYAVTLTAKVVTGSGRNQTTTYYNTTVTITVTGEDAPVVEPEWTENVPYIGENGNWFVNGEDTGVKAQGPAGEDGVDGVDGAPGKDGVDGVDGAPGKDGTNGKDGVNGKDGKDGVDGAPGADGKDGVDGKDGADGQDALAALGCTSSISLGVITLVALAGAAVVLRKKED